MPAKVAAVASVEPHMALKSVAPTTVVMASPPGDMADELVGGLIQPFGDVGIGGDLAHEHEEGDYRKAVGGEGVEKILDQQIAGGAEADQVGEAHKTHDRHGEGQFDARKEKQQQ